jgi:hypothetical protein
VTRTTSPSNPPLTNRSQRAVSRQSGHLPAFPGAKREIRRVPSIDESPQDNEWIVKKRAWRERTGQL